MQLRTGPIILLSKVGQQLCTIAQHKAPQPVEWQSTLTMIPKRAPSDLPKKIKPVFKTREDSWADLRPTSSSLSQYGRDQHQQLLRFFDCFKFSSPENARKTGG
ncbi:hypothetical protein [Vampirovibrio sp.]|uniref:hypothetical protein n=1 Tax=Vampirovibrio sp. TaxID=2717857 RepID=UPI00359325B2